MQEKVFVIIVTYNAEKWIKKCLNSVSTHSIIIIDNCSTDNTLSIIKENDKESVLILNKDNLGFAESNNIGIKKAILQGAEYVFLLNHDAWVEPDTINQLISTSRKNPRYGILSPIHLNGEGNLLDWSFTNYISKPSDDGRKLYTDLLKKEKLAPIYSVDFVNAAAWLLTKRCIEKVGLFDSELLPHYGEDNNYIQRAHYHEFFVGICPNSFIYHDREQRSGTKTKKPFNSITNYRPFIINAANILKENALFKSKEDVLFDKMQRIKKIIRLNFKLAYKHHKSYQLKRSLLKKIISHRELYKKEGFKL